MEAISQKESWADLYQQALFEDDFDRLSLMVEQAQQAVERRVRELWESLDDRGVTDREQRELRAAAYYLGLLRSLAARKAGN